MKMVTGAAVDIIKDGAEVLACSDDELLRRHSPSNDPRSSHQQALGGSATPLYGSLLTSSLSASR